MRAGFLSPQTSLVPHHASRTQATPPFVQTLQPSIPHNPAGASGLAPPTLRFQPTIGIHRADAEENGKIIAQTANGAPPDLVCLDFDGCFSLLPLTSDADLAAFVQAGGMGSPERLAALRKSLAALVHGDICTGKKTRVCILSLNKTIRIKVLLNLLGFGDIIKEVYGCDVAPYGATKAQRMAQLCTSRNAVLFDDNIKNVMEAAQGGFGAVRAAPLGPEMLERLVAGQ